MKLIIHPSFFLSRKSVGNFMPKSSPRFPRNGILISRNQETLSMIVVALSLTVLLVSNSLSAVTSDFWIEEMVESEITEDIFSLSMIFLSSASQTWISTEEDGWSVSILEISRFFICTTSDQMGIFNNLLNAFGSTSSGISVVLVMISV